jgi:hypothetical protein
MRAVAQVDYDIFFLRATSKCNRCPPARAPNIDTRLLVAHLVAYANTVDSEVAVRMPILVLRVGRTDPQRIGFRRIRMVLAASVVE